MAKDTRKKVLHFLSIIEFGTEANMVLKNGHLIRGRKEVDQMFSQKRQWKVIIGVLNRDSEGKSSMNLFEPLITPKIRLTDDWLKQQTDHDIDHLQQIVDDPQDMLTRFFIVTPQIDEDITDESLIALFVKLGVYEKLLTPRELTQFKQDGIKGLRTIDPLKYSNKATWTILNRYGVKDFADFRLYGLEQIQQFKGIGKKRIDQLSQDYEAMLNAEYDNPLIYPMCRFEQEMHRQRQIIDIINDTTH